MTSQSASIIPSNRLKKTLKEGGTAIGTFVVEFRQTAVLQLLANAGMQFVTLDNEHGAFSMETIGEMCRAAVWLGITPLVRIPEISYPWIAQTMDVGAQGLMVPRITSAERVRQVVRWMRYPPQGERGNAMERGLTQFRSAGVAQTLLDIQRETFLIVQIETVQAVEQIDEILAVDGVDAALIGPNDLSIALGTPGQQDHPSVQEAIFKTIAACRAHQVIPAIHMSNLELASFWAGQGMRLVSTGSDVAFLGRSAQAAVTTLRKAFEHP